MIRYAAITRKGVGKEQNEDRVMVAGNYLSDGEVQSETDSYFMAVVCDGVGGEAFGNEAAEIASKSFLSHSDRKHTIYSIMNVVTSINELILQLQKTDLEHKNMSSTLAGMYLDETQIITFNLGDSRVYSYADGVLSLLTTDHIDGKSITRCFGGNGVSGTPSIWSGSVHSDSTSFLLCSDGIFKFISRNEICDILKKNINCREKIRAILNFALWKGSVDDLSVVLVNRGI